MPFPIGMIYRRAQSACSMTLSRFGIGGIREVKTGMGGSMLPTVEKESMSLGNAGGLTPMPDTVKNWRKRSASRLTVASIRRARKKVADIS